MSFLNDIEFIRERIDLAEYKDKYVLITGATGFFGSWLTYALNGRCILTLANRENIKECLRGEYDYIFHCAPCDIRPIIDCAFHDKSKVLFTSSGAVYGTIYDRPKEDAPLLPKTSYALTKLKDEIHLKGSGLDYVIARCYAFCGAHMRNLFALTAFINALQTGHPLNVLNRGMSVRSYLYAADLAVWLLTLMVKGDGVYNVGSEHETTIKQLAEMVADYATPHAPIIYSDKEFIETQPYYVPDCTKAHRLGLYQWHDLEYGLRRMING